MFKKAYLIFHINKKTLKIDFARIYSEEYPTVNLNKYFTVLALQAEAHSFKKAQKLILATIASDFEHYKWLKDTPGVNWDEILLKVYKGHETSSEKA